MISIYIYTREWDTGMKTWLIADGDNCAHVNVVFGFVDICNANQWADLRRKPKFDLCGWDKISDQGFIRDFLTLINQVFSTEEIVLTSMNRAQYLLTTSSQYRQMSLNHNLGIPLSPWPVCIIQTSWLSEHPHEDQPSRYIWGKLALLHSTNLGSSPSIHAPLVTSDLLDCSNTSPPGSLLQPPSQTSLWHVFHAHDQCFTCVPPPLHYLCYWCKYRFGGHIKWYLPQPSLSFRWVLWPQRSASFTNNHSHMLTFLIIINIAGQCLSTLKYLTLLCNLQYKRHSWIILKRIKAHRSRRSAYEYNSVGSVFVLVLYTVEI